MYFRIIKIKLFNLKINKFKKLNFFLLLKKLKQFSIVIQFFKHGKTSKLLIQNKPKGLNNLLIR